MWWFQIFFNFHPYLGKNTLLTNIFRMGWNHQPVLKKQSTLKTDAWWSLTWHFYSALAGTPKKSVKVRGLDHPNMTGDFRKSGGCWIHNCTKSLTSKFLSGTPERGSGDSKTSDVILLANDIWAAKSWNKRPALYDKLFNWDDRQRYSFLIVNHPLVIVKHTLTFPKNNTF